MQPSGLVALCAGMIVIAAPGMGHAGEVQTLGFRLGDHHSFGRLVVPFSDATPVAWSRNGDEVTLKTNAVFDERPVGSEHAPGIVSVAAQNDRLIVHIQPGATIHTWHLGRRFVLDVAPGTSRPAAEKPRNVPGGHISEATKAPEGTVLPGLPAPMVAVVDTPLALPSPLRPPR